VFYAFKIGTGMGFIPVGWESRYADGIPAGAIIIKDEQRQDYFSKNQQGFDIVDDIWTYTEPAGATADEIKQQQLDALDAEYQPQFVALSQALGMATLAENTDLIASIKEDYTALKAEYDGKREVITNG
jgi:hypothetical protein